MMPWDQRIAARWKKWSERREKWRIGFLRKFDDWSRRWLPEKFVRELDLAGRLAAKHTPFIMQMEAVECGAAALAIVLGYYGRFEPLAELRVACGVSRDGSKASNILKAARNFGLVAKGYSKGLNKLEEVRLPCIVFWEFNHFIVVEGFSKDFVYVNDPAFGHRRISRENFATGFTGVVLCFEPTAEFEPKGSLPSPFPVLWRHTEGSREALVFVMLCGLLAAAPGIAMAACTRVLLDEVITQGRYDWMRPLLTGMAFILVFQLCLTALSGLFFRRLQMGLSARLSGRFYRHLLNLPYQFYSQRYVGDVVDRSRLIDSIVGLMAGQLTSTAVGLVTMILFGIVLFTYNPLLASIGLLSTLLNFVLLQSVVKSRVEANILISKEAGKVQGITIATIGSIDTIKASGLETSMYEKWAGYFAAASNSRLKLELDNRMFTVLPTLTTAVVNTATLLIGGFQVMNGDMTFGTLMAFNVLMGQFLGPISALLGLAVQMQQIRGNVVRLEDVMEHPTRQDLEVRERARLAAALTAGAKPNVPLEVIERVVVTGHAGGNGNGQAAAPATLRKTRLDGRVSFQGLCYGYSPLGEPLLDHFNLEIEPGERVALVGRSGCGKSTVAKLAAGLLQPWAGDILFDGMPRGDIPRDVLASSMAMIEQDLMFFGGSIRANLTLWDETVPDKWLLDACEDAEILEAVLSLPGGLDAVVGEGANNFSGGQRQRIEIARSLVRNPSFLIMDESTSALDTETEAKIMNNIHRRGSSCLIIAHRLSTIRNCHKIMVLERGRVIEAGTYDELWKKGGAFAAQLKRH
jgi:ATP-binding cassette subfamily C protein